VTSDSASLLVEEEVVVSKGRVVEEVHKDKLIRHEGACNERVRKVVYRHCVVVYVKLLVYVKFVSFDFLFCSEILSKGSKLKNSIIDVRDGKLVTHSILLYLFELDVTIRKPSEFLFKSNGVALKIILLHPVLSIALLGDGDSRP
jgi:hypothetical protein